MINQIDLHGVIPIPNQRSGHAIWGRVYLPRHICQELDGSDPGPHAIALLAHEREHLRRADNYGRLTWHTRYLLDRHFRFAEELAATVVQMDILKQAGVEFDREHRARQLSGAPYLWAVSYDQALRNIEEAWQLLD